MTEKMPVLFTGHGSPMIALENNEITREMRRIGDEIIDKYSKPKAILAISAHWYTDKTLTQSSETPKQIYDMYGFPQELYDLKYPVSGSKELSDEIINLVDNISVDDDWGIDHGTWSVLIHIFPKADIPIVQLSVNSNLTPKECFQIGEKLTKLRNEGYLIFASGNIVHNLRMVEWDNPNGSLKTLKFNDTIIDKIKNKDYESLIDYKNIPDWDYAIPTPEHYLPLLYILGASGRDDVEIFNNVCNLGSISMTGFIFKP